MHLLIRLTNTQQKNRSNVHTSKINSNQRSDQTFFTIEIEVQELTNLNIRFSLLQHFIHTNSTIRLNDDNSNECNNSHAIIDDAIDATINDVRSQNFNQHNSTYFSSSNFVYEARESRTTCDLKSRQKCSITIQSQ